ncbi:hypothetical protein [Pectinatus frisingensis]|uniref:hypothetical protein n=1 Tax=Pectinatus frisingensis TaxID=865 RepID=UPI0018C6E66E|nr:hypothetical protein [Pectinatus frisingensis]
MFKLKAKKLAALLFSSFMAITIMGTAMVSAAHKDVPPPPPQQQQEESPQDQQPPQQPDQTPDQPQPAPPMP